MSRREGFERRECERTLVTSASTRFNGVKLLPGRPTTLVDLSEHGALVESEARLPPGVCVEVQLLSTGVPVVRLRARVVRCAVAALPRGRAVQYRAGLSFESTVCMGRD